MKIINLIAILFFAICTVFSLIFKTLKKQKRIPKILEKAYITIASFIAITLIILMFFIDSIFPKYIYPNKNFLLPLIIALILFSITFTDVINKVGDTLFKKT